MGNDCSGCVPDKADKPGFLREYDNQEEALKKMHMQQSSQPLSLQESQRSRDNIGTEIIPMAANLQEEADPKREKAKITNAMMSGIKNSDSNNNHESSNPVSQRAKDSTIPYEQLSIRSREKTTPTIMPSQEQISTGQGQNDHLELRNEVVLENGATYFGQWRGEMREGHGTQRWPDGAVYEGEWKQDRASGKGKFSHANGDVFEGDWSNDQANGQGVFTHKDGSTYEGQWKNDLQDGFGVHRWNDGSKFEGYKVQGIKQGQGKYEWSDGSSYEGNWMNDSLNGVGLYIWKDGRSYQGMWKDNFMEGKGKYSWQDGRFYEGEFSKDKRHGYGVYQWKDGKRYEGYWLEGKQHGKGRYVFPDKTVKFGVFEHGKKSKDLTQQEFDAYIQKQETNATNNQSNNKDNNNPIDEMIHNSPTRRQFFSAAPPEHFFSNNLGKDQEKENNGNISMPQQSLTLVPSQSIPILNHNIFSTQILDSTNYNNPVKLSKNNSQPTIKPNRERLQEQIQQQQDGTAEQNIHDSHMNSSIGQSQRISQYQIQQQKQSKIYQDQLVLYGKVVPPTGSNILQSRISQQ